MMLELDKKKVGLYNCLFMSPKFVLIIKVNLDPTDTFESQIQIEDHTAITIKVIFIYFPGKRMLNFKTNN